MQLFVNEYVPNESEGVRIVRARYFNRKHRKGCVLCCSEQKREPGDVGRGATSVS